MLNCAFSFPLVKVEAVEGAEVPAPVLLLVEPAVVAVQFLWEAVVVEGAEELFFYPVPSIAGQKNQPPLPGAFSFSYINICHLDARLTCFHKKNLPP